MTARPHPLDWWPWLAAAAYAAAVASPATREFAVRLQEENGPIESLTFGLLLLAAALLTAAGLRAGRSRATGFWLLAAAGCLFVAGEEIAWGQHWLGRPLFPGWAEANRQQETTLHNLPALQGMSELWYLVAAGAGLAATRGRIAQLLGPAAVTSRLAPALLLVAALALAELLAAFAPARAPFDALARGLQPMGEWNELTIGGIAAVYGAQARRAARARSSTSAA